MKKIIEYSVARTQKSTYVTPLISCIEINADILTQSHDPNMGEWDTEINSRRVCNEKHQI